MPDPANPSPAPAPTHGGGANPSGGTATMDPLQLLVTQLASGWGLLAQGAYADVATAQARQRDAAHITSLAAQGTTFRVMTEAADPAFDSNLNAAVQTPSGNAIRGANSLTPGGLIAPAGSATPATH